MAFKFSISRAIAPASCAVAFLVSAAAFGAGSPDLVISQVYGGGGNAGATYKNDFIEIFNRGSAAVSLNGKSVQYGSTTGNLGGSNLTVLPNTLLQPGQYFLIQEAAGAGGTANLPAPDATGSINMSATGGKVALVNSTASLNCNGVATACPATIIDLVGYDGATFFEGTATPILSNASAAVRKSGGCTDTDNNAADFSVLAPAPRNSADVAVSCTGPINPSASGTASPSSVSAGDTTTLTVTATPGTSPASTGLSVTGDLSSIGGSSLTAFTDNGGGIFSFVATIAGSTSTGTKAIGVTVSDAQGRSGSTIISLTVTPPVPRLAIHDIQGTGLFSRFSGQLVQTEGVVTAIKTNGFFVQAPDAEADGDPNTAEGIFVFTGTGSVPAAAAVGNRVSVRAKVQDFVPASDPFSPPVTELSSSPVVAVISSGNPMPAAVTITSADLNPAGSVSQLAKYEGMRAHVDVLNVVAPSGGTINEVSATSTSTGAFYGVIPGVPRPFREEGIEAPEPAPAGVPQFDANPERFRVDTGGQVGATALNVGTGATVSNLTGVMDFTFRSYSLVTDPGTPPAVTNNDPHAIPVRAGAGEGEIAVASFNMERFYDTADDPATSDAILTPAAFELRKTKASLVIRNVLQMPDIIGVEEMEHLSTLQAVADRVNADAIAANQPNPQYVAFLEEGNDIGGIDVGFLVKSTRIDLGSLEVQQLNKDETFTEPAGTVAILNDRPPLVMKATVRPFGKELPFQVRVIVNHLRSLSGINSATDGARIRLKRRKQAESLARLIDGFQQAGERVISVGDYNAFDVNDGYTDVISIVRGGPPHPAEDLEGEPDQLVATPLVDLAPADPAQRYSYVFDGNAQVLDHIIVSQSLTVNEFTYARNDADFPESLRADPTRPERVSDHDMPVAYFAIARDTEAPLVTVTGVIEGAFYGPGALPVPGCTTSDDASGVRTPATLQITGGDGSGGGSFTATCTGAVDNVGNAAADVSVHYAIDLTPPVVTLTGVAEGAVYGPAAVPAASCNTTDAASGVRTPAILSTTGGDATGGGSFTATCSGAVDSVGNVALDVSVHFVVDATPPVVTVTGVADGATYLLGSVPAAGCATTDPSGVRTPATLQVTGGDGSGAGAFTATCSGAVDSVGNTAASVSVHYRIVTYSFGGFEPPLGEVKKTPVVKRGAIVPVIFEISDWTGKAMTSTSVVSAIEYAPNATCSGTPSGGWQPADAFLGIPLVSIFKHYVFLWNTAPLSPGCYSIAVRTADTLRHPALIIIK